MKIGYVPIEEIGGADQQMTDIGSAEPELIIMLRKLVGKRRPISRSSAIYQDLRIAGDDAFELLAMISARFGTSFGKLDWRTYFPDETEAGIWHWARIVGIRDTRRRILTVEHLLLVIERGAWFDPGTSN